MNTIELHLSEKAAATLGDLAKARQRTPEDVASEVLSHQLEKMSAKKEAVPTDDYSALRRRGLVASGGRTREEIDQDLQTLRDDR